MQFHLPYDLLTDGLVTLIFQYLDDFNMQSSKEMKLVFFMDAIEHVTRIARMIRQERGNALLVGVGGCGKQSLTRLAAHINGYKSFQIELSRGYDYAAFHDDLKKLYDMAGVQNLNTVFLFTDTQVKHIQNAEILFLLFPGQTTVYRLLKIWNIVVVTILPKIQLNKS